MAKRHLMLKPEHVQRLAKASPADALEELIWNGLDAGGPLVDVRLSISGFGKLQTIVVQDFGVGIPFAELDATFGEVGNSRKPAHKINIDQRRLVGSEGKGRLKALEVIS